MNENLLRLDVDQINQTAKSIHAAADKWARVADVLLAWDLPLGIAASVLVSIAAIWLLKKVLT
jgi:hypothetical protein